MSSFLITAPDGRKLKITGDTMPSEQELDDIFEATGTKQSVMDDRDGKVYNMPVTMDGLDATFAIDTQHKGKDVNSFFGKVEFDGQNMFGDKIAKMRDASAKAGEKLKSAAKSAARGVVGGVEGLVDTAIYNITDQDQNKRIAAGKTYNPWRGANEAMASDPWEMPDEEMQAEAKLAAENVQKIRDNTKEKFTKVKENIKPEKEMDDLDRWFEGLGNGAFSVLGSIGAAVTMKSPSVAAGSMAALYGRMRQIEFLDEAEESGMDYDKAYTLSVGAGAIEGGLEFVGDKVLFGVSKIKPIQDLTNKVITEAAIKMAQKKVGKEAVKKIGTRHANSVFGAFVKGGATEALEEGSQESIGMIYDNLAGVQDYEASDIIGQTLLAASTAFVTGGVAGGGGQFIYNRSVRGVNDNIKAALQKIEPELNETELQVTADALQEIFFQHGGEYVKELNNVLGKEISTQSMPENLTPESLTAETRKFLKEKYNMSDEEINKTVQAGVNLIDIRSQYAEAYNLFRDGLELSGRDMARADGEARILAARAVALAREEGKNVKDILDRWGLRFQQMRFADFYREHEGQLRNPKDLEMLSRDAFNDLKNYKAGKELKGQSLLAFIKSRGGLKDTGGELKAMDADKSYIGLINNTSGNSIDDMTQTLWDKGYFVGEERPTVNQLLEAISDELAGKKRYSMNQDIQDSRADEMKNLADELARIGVNIENDSYGEVNRKMREADKKAKDYRDAAEFYDLSEDQQERYAVMRDNGASHEQAMAAVQSVGEDEIQFQMAGPKALTAALDKLDQAKQLDADGVDNEEIRQQTGWFKGVDGKWRFEISDKDAVVDLIEDIRAQKTSTLNEWKEMLKNRPDEEGEAMVADLEKQIKELGNIDLKKFVSDIGGYKTKLGNILKHDKLFEAYPELRDMEVRINVDKSNHYAGFHSMGYAGDIFSAPSHEHIVINLAHNDSNEEIRKTVLHEVQHAIQERENFARGGTQEDAADYLRSALARVENSDLMGEFVDQTEELEMLYDVINVIEVSDDPGKVAKKGWFREKYLGVPKNKKDKAEFLREKSQEFLDYINSKYKGWGSTTDKYMEYLQMSKEDLQKMIRSTTRKLNNMRDKLYTKGYLRAKDLIDKFENHILTANDLYMQLAGEIEARNTEERADLSEEERRAKTPESTQDIKNADAIVVFGDGVAMAYKSEPGENITQTEGFKNWSHNAPVYWAKDVENHKFKTGAPLVAEVFHGTKRSDRVGNVFLPERATSGPMAFSTSNKEIATNYAKTKEDTSLKNELEGDFHKWFKVKIPGYNAVTLDRLWSILPYDKKQEVREKAPHITTDEEGENIIYDENAKNGNGGYNETYYRGNALEGLVDSWLMSGTLWDEEQKFLDVMKLAGLGEYEIQYVDPNADYSKVYELFVEMQNPLVSDDVPEKVIKKIEREAKKQPKPDVSVGVDLWDKQSQDPEVWAKGLREGDVYIWTSIPDWVTNVFKSFGYDGIVDRGGKGGGIGHTVFIPFYSSQYKSVDNVGTFDPNNPDIRFQLDPMQRGQAAPKGAYANNIIYLFENADASTVIHEMAHFFLDDMRKYATSEKTKEQLQAVYNYLGSTDGNLSYEQNEYFADSFEVYLMEGKAPNQLLAKVFARFKKWMRVIWSEVKRLNGIKLTDEMRKTFDDMLGGRSLDFAMQMGGQKMTNMSQSGYISPVVAQRAVDLLKAGKMSRADMDDILERLKTGELQRSDVAAELKKFEEGNAQHNERLDPFDTVKYKEALLKDNVNKTKVLEKIERLMEWAKPKEVNGRTVGRFPDKKMNDFFIEVAKEMSLDKEEAKKRIAENKGIISAILQSAPLPEMERNTILGMRISENDRPELLNALALENRVLSVAAKNISLDNAVKLYNDLQDSYNLGRLTANVTGDLKKARKNRMISDAIRVLVGVGNKSIKQERSELVKRLNRFGSSMMSWNGLMDILSMNDKQSSTGMSELSKMMDVFECEQAEANGIAADGEELSRLFEKKLAGLGNSGIAVSKYINNELNKKSTIEWDTYKQTFTKDELIDIYMKAKDKETREIMIHDEIKGYNESFLAVVNQNLTAEDRAFGDALFEFYNENWKKINAFYEEKYGVTMPKNDYYSPRSITREGISVSTGDMMAYAASGFTKKRTAKVGATVDIQGAFKVWNNYAVKTNRWLAWSDKLVDINSVFGNVEVKDIIERLFGSAMNARIRSEVERMAGGDQNKFFNSPLITKIRSNYARSVLALKPALMIKQLTSFPAYWNEMSAKDFAEGLADFFAHPKEAMEILGNTTLMKTRGTDIIRDFAVMSKMDVLKGKKGIKWSDAIMLNIKLGDRGAIYMGGWALYKSELKKNLAKGMKEEDAKAKALERFERVTDETQQSGRLSQQSFWQSNPALRMFTMFQSSQNQYLRKEIAAVRGVLTGRMDKTQAAKQLFIFHVLLPCLFQLASDGFDWDKDAQLRAAIIGSLNGVFVLSKILEKLYDKVVLDKGAFNSRSLGVREVVPFWGSMEDLVREFEKLADGDVDLTDAADAFEAFSKTAKAGGELSGVPLKYPLDVIKNFGSYAEEGEYAKEIMLWLGWSPYALRDDDE